MGDMPESPVSIPELSNWRSSVTWSGTRKNWRRCERQLKSDMYRHMARLHLDSAVAVPSVMVYRLEGHTSGQYGSPAWSPQCAGGGQVGLP